MSAAGAQSPSPSGPPKRKTRGQTKVSEAQLAAAVVLGMHRLVKQSTLYTTENEAQTRQIALTQRAVLGYGRRTGRNPKIFFTETSVFVCGRLLRAGRGVYEAALELGRILDRFGIDEVTVGFDVSTDELKQFQQHAAQAIRRSGLDLNAQRYSRIRLKKGVPPGTRPGKQDDELAPEERIIRTYATSVVVMRRFLQAVQQGIEQLPNRVRRIAQQFADLGAVQSPAFLGTTALYNARHEHAGRAVNTAMIALGMARQITDDKRLLARIALACLLYDVGVPRVFGTGPLGDDQVGLNMPNLIDDQYPELPAATAVMTTKLGGMSAVSKTTTVLIFEAIHVARHDVIDRPYGGVRAPTMEARIIAVARRFNEFIADPDEEHTADDAVRKLWHDAQDDAQKTAVRLLMGALGLFPTGTLVELDTGSIAQVERVSDEARHFSLPVVRPLMDASGGTGGGQPIDLAATAGQPDAPRITRIVGMDDLAVGHVRHEQAAPASAPAAPQNAFEAGAAAAYGFDEAPAASSDYGTQPAEQTPYPGDAYGSQYPNEGYGDEVSDVAPASQGSYGSHPGGGYPSAAPYGGADYGSAPAPPSQSSYAPYGTPSHGTQHPGQPARPTPGMGYEQSGGYPAPGSHPGAIEFDDGDSYDGDTAHALTARAPVAASVVERGYSDPRPLEQSPDEIDWDSAETNIDDDDDDDVPSMVLQAIVDGREGEEQEEEQGTSVFAGELQNMFFKKGGGPEGAPPNPAPRGPRDRGAAVDQTTGPARVGGAIAMGPPPNQAAQRSPIAPPATKQPLFARRAAESAPPPSAEPVPAPARRQLSTSDWLRDKLTQSRPTAQGNLEKTPLVHLLVYMLDRALTGTLMLVGDGAATNFIYLDRGVPSKARTHHAVAPLDRVLTEMNQLDPHTLARTQQEAKAAGCLHGRYLVQNGHVDAKTIQAALGMQVARKVESMLDMPPTTRYAFYGYENFLDDYGGPELYPIEPLSIVMGGVRRLSRGNVLLQTLHRLGNSPLRLRREADIKRLNLVEDERRVIELMRVRAMTLRDLVDRDVAPVGIVQHTVYATVIARFLNMGGNQKPPVGSETPPVDETWRAYLTSSKRTTMNASRRADAMRPQPRRSFGAMPAAGATPAVTVENQDGALPRRGTASTGPLAVPPRRAQGPASSSPGRGQPAPLPRRGAGSSGRGEPLPRRGSATGQGALPRRGTSSAGGAIPRHGSTTSRGNEAQQNPSIAPPPASNRPDRPRAARGSGPGGAPPRSSHPNAGPPSQPSAPSRPSAPQARTSSPGGARASSPGASGRPRARGASPPTRRVAAPEANELAAQAGRQGARKGGLNRDEVIRLAKKIDNQTFYEILGVEDTATPAAIQTAYFGLAKQWHPDRLPPNLVDLKTEVAKVFGRINDAFQTLSNTDKRREYQEVVQQGGGTARDREIVERAVDSALLFQKGEVLFKKGSYRQAEDLVRQAAEADPDQPEYRALLAWIQAHRIGPPDGMGEGETTDRYDRQIEILDGVLETEPEYERARFYRGTLLKRSGHVEQAYKDFRMVMQLNPRNIDAAREVRLYKMRQKQGGGQKGSGILGRFFKKK